MTEMYDPNTLYIHFQKLKIQNMAKGLESSRL